MQGVLADELANSASDPLTGYTLFLLSLHGDLSWKKAISTPLAAPEREGCIVAGGVPAEINVWAMSLAQLFFSFDLREQRKCVPKGSHTTHTRRRRSADPGRNGFSPGASETAVLSVQSCHIQLLEHVPMFVSEAQQHTV